MKQLYYWMYDIDVTGSFGGRQVIHVYGKHEHKITSEKTLEIWDEGELKAVFSSFISFEIKKKDEFQAETVEDKDFLCLSLNMKTAFTEENFNKLQQLREKITWKAPEPMFPSKL